MYFILIYILLILNMIHTLKLHCHSSIYPRFNHNNYLKFKSDSNIIDNEYYTTSYSNPPFFPKNIFELAQDTTFSIKVALINRISRMRIDIQSRMLLKERYMIEYVILLGNLLSDDEFKQIHLFIDDKYNIQKWKDIYDEMINNKHIHLEQIANHRNKPLLISSIDDRCIADKDDLYIIFNPDNIYNTNINSNNNKNLIEELQALCFHASLKNKPVIMINPKLVATAWNDYGVRSPLLLSDFAQVYYICDDYFMLATKDQWIGIIQRAATGFDMFYLEGFLPNQIAPHKYTRIKSWIDGMPDDLRKVVGNIILADPNFGSSSSMNNTSSSIIEKSYVIKTPGVTYNNNNYHQDNNNMNEENKYSNKFIKSGTWRNITPPPSSFR